MIKKLQTESSVQEKTVTYARKQLMKAAKYRNENRRSAPDYIFFYSCVCFMIEFKKEGEVATAAQLREHKQYENQGIAVYVVDTREFGKDVINFVKKAIDEKGYLRKSAK